MTIKDLMSNDSIYFVHEEKENDKIDKSSKEKEPQKKREDKNEINEIENNKNEKFIHIYKNSEPIKMVTFDMNISLAKLRELIDDNIFENSKFLSEGNEVPMKDEKNIKLFNIIKEEKIYMEDSNSQSVPKNLQKEGEKMKVKEKIPIILKLMIIVK